MVSEAAVRVAVQITAVVEALRICTVPTGYPPPVGPATVAEKVSAVSDPSQLWPLNG